VSLIDENSVLADFTTEGTSEEHNHLELNKCLKKLNDEAAALSGKLSVYVIGRVVHLTKYNIP